MLSPEFSGRSGVVLERLQRLYPALIDLSLGRLEALLAKLDHPEQKLPPVIHVAGTNGKGSTCAHVRAIAEAAGLVVHATTSPHLVEVTERFRVAGRLVTEAHLVATLERIERVNAGAPITVFEVLTACAFLLFAETPADLAIIEVGLGGRYDATNVLAGPAACAIASLSMDHEGFLGNTLAGIAREKAGIIKPGSPVVTGRHQPEALAEIVAEAERQQAPLLLRDRDWTIERTTNASRPLRYQDRHGVLELPLPGLDGPHQIDNAGLAIVVLRASGLTLPEHAFAGIARATWPARMQRLSGRLAATLPPGWELWLDGGHNPGAGLALAATLDAWSDRPVHLLVGMKQSKDPAGFLAPLLAHAETVWAVSEPGQHLALPVETIVASSGGVARPGPTVAQALSSLFETPRLPGRILICGSLYLAGEVLKADGWVPD
ncbi:MAG: bifunctional folylpolyglutamate synthase/dihydrofolate synthase [Janthinobacterium lividum]